MTKLRDEFEKTVLEATEEDITKHTKAAQKTVMHLNVTINLLQLLK